MSGILHAKCNSRTRLLELTLKIEADLVAPVILIRKEWHHDTQGVCIVEKFDSNVSYSLAFLSPCGATGAVEFKYPF